MSYIHDAFMQRVKQLCLRLLFPSLPVFRNSNNNFAKVETYTTISKILKTQVLILQLIQVLESCVVMMGLVIRDNLH